MSYQLIEIRGTETPSKDKVLKTVNRDKLDALYKERDALNDQAAKQEGGLTALRYGVRPTE